MRRRLPGERVFNGVMLALALGALWQAYGIAGLSALSSPGAFPMAVAAVMVIAASLTLLRDRQRLAGTAGWRDVLPVAVTVTFLLLLGFAALLDRLGFLLAGLGFLLLAIGFLDRGGWLRTVSVSLGSLVAVYVVFRLVFKVILPEGILPERDILAWLGL